MTTAPTIRALELKEQQHRADVAELVRALKAASNILDVVLPCIDGFDPNTGMGAVHNKLIRPAIAKHGA